MFNNTYDEWLKNIKIGDLFYTEYNHRYVKHTVSRITKTLIISEENNIVNNKYELKFNRTTGNLISNDKWDYNHMIQPTEEIFLKIKRNNIIYRISYINFSKIENDKLFAIYDFLKLQGEVK